MINDITDLRTLAGHYFELGFNVTCINNYRNKFNYTDQNLWKAPSHEWESYSEKRQTINELNSYDWNTAIGLGVVLGFDGLIAIDLDGCIELDFLFWICDILNLDYNYDWIVKSGSNSGFHIILMCSNRPKPEEIDVKCIERGWNGWVNGCSDFGYPAVNAYYPKLYWPSTRSSPYYDKSIMEVYFNEKYRIEWLFEKIEFRWENHLVLPNSLHRSNLRYHFLNNFPTQKPVEVDFQLLEKLKTELCQEKSHLSGTEYYIINKTCGDDINSLSI